MTRLKLTLAATLLAFCHSSARAELPPSAYEALQRAAPELLVIKVRQVKTRQTEDPQGTRIDIEAEARVERLLRSKGGSAEGMAIRIVYVHRIPKEPMPGPGEVPILKEGETCPAYLRRGEKAGAYAPAAGAYSFRYLD